MKEFVEKILSELEKHIFSAELYNYEWKGQAVHNLLCLGDVKNVAEQLAEEYNNGWIPCSERLPDESGEYLTYVDYADETFIAIDEIDCDGIIKEWNCTPNYHVVAWQPLPKPYKE